MNSAMATPSGAPTTRAIAEEGRHTGQDEDDEDAGARRGEAEGAVAEARPHRPGGRCGRGGPRAGHQEMESTAVFAWVVSCADSGAEPAVFAAACWPSALMM